MRERGKRWLGLRLTVKEWDKNAQSNGVQVLQKIIGRPVQRHRSRLGDEIVPNLDPADKVKWEEKKHLNTC